jgi:hypothetical protein
VIVEYLSQPGDWLVADISFPILREIARATYNYFNLDQPYMGNVNEERTVIDPDDPFAEIPEEEGESEPVEGESEGVQDESGNE